MTRVVDEHGRVANVIDTFDRSRRVRKDSPSAVAKAIINENTKQWFIGVLMALSIAANVLLYFQFANAERETRMLEYYVLEMDAKLIAAGFKTDAESVAKRLKENEP
jgi:hypothetical protein